MKKQLESIRQRKFVGVAELASEAAKILAESGLAQERGTVSDVPDERTIRYYLTEGLVSPAEDKQGTASVFGYRHLLQLLVVKKLQAEHLPIRKIRELVESREVRDLERLLGLDGGTTSKNEALSYLEKLLTKPAPANHASYARPLNFSSSVSPSIAPSMPSPQFSQSSGSAGAWERIEIEPGLELHVQSSYQPPTDTRGLRRLTQVIMRLIESSGLKPGK
ncbi:MAG TPA: MerR family transcriptional regulator [Pyrinomonadaceae bacterium]|jgi:DNA-binding transcriptional MerR regulator